MVRKASDGVRLLLNIRQTRCDERRKIIVLLTPGEFGNDRDDRQGSLLLPRQSKFSYHSIFLSV